MKGTIEDVAASPNDPLFIVHHTMIDCVLEEWLKLHVDAEYPTSPMVRDGHRRDDYIRGFFPLYTNVELFERTEEFGYSCNLASLTQPSVSSPTTTTATMAMTTAAALTLVTYPLVLLVGLLIAVITL